MGSVSRLKPARNVLPVIRTWTRATFVIERYRIASVGTRTCRIPSVKEGGTQQTACSAQRVQRHDQRLDHSAEYLSGRHLNVSSSAASHVRDRSTLHARSERRSASKSQNTSAGHCRSNARDRSARVCSTDVPRRPRRRCGRAHDRSA